MRYLSANQFDVFEEIGKGGFGVVYRGIDKVTKKQVAIKQIDLESTDSLDDLQREIRILSECKLAQITQYQGSFVKGYKLWIILEYLDGGSCADLLAPGPIEERYIASLLKELLIALCYLHENSRIHRDVKAANILLNSKGEVKIADFGVSTQLSNNLSRRNTFVGSPYWMSPEVILEEEYNFKADVWSLGITAIELATGKPPLSHIPPMKVLFQIPELGAPRLEGSQFSQDFKDFVEMCLQKNPANRPTAKRLLKTRFMSNAPKTTYHLTGLIARKEDWDAAHETELKKRKKNYYVPTMAEKDDDKVTFDFEDSHFERTAPSSVIITKSSPSKYNRLSSAVKRRDNTLKENNNIVNTMNNSYEQQHVQSRSDIKSVSSGLGRGWSTLKLESPMSSEMQESPVKMEFERIFHSAVTKTHQYDESEMRKLLAVGEMLKELKDDTLVDFSREFSQQTNDSLVFNGSNQDIHRPKKVESEKLLLKRWADQYFA